MILKTNLKFKKGEKSQAFILPFPSEFYFRFNQIVDEGKFFIEVISANK